MKRIPELGLIGEAALREAAATELGQIMDLVRAALQTTLGQNQYFGTEAMYPDRVIICQGGRYYAYPYSIGADNTVTLGAPQEVVEQYLPVKMTEAAASDFLEAADAEGTVWDATLIRAGLSLNRTFYPDAVLREALPLFDGRPIFAKGDLQHLKGEGKDVRNIVGWISAPKFIEGATSDTGRVVGRVNLSAATSLREVLADAWKRGKKDLAGLSIDADGTAKSEMREAKTVRVATKISKVNSVDLIVEPGAGGALVRMVEAATKDDNDAQEEHDNMKLKQRMLEAIKAKNPEAAAKINLETVTDDELEAAYREALMAAPVDKKDMAAGDVKDAPVTREELRMVEARAYARTTIAGCNLPQAAKDKLTGYFSGHERFTEAHVDDVIKAERAYLAKFTESGRVVMDGDIQVEDRPAKMAGMLDAFFDPAHKDHRAAQSFKECYIEMTGDKRVTGRIEHCDRARLRESVGAAFRESLDSTSFGYVLGDSITRRMVAEFRAAVEFDAWRKIASVVPVGDFRTQERTLFGGYGDLPAVAQGAPYASLASPTDQHATYAATKRGGTEDITLEMVKNDNVGAIARIPVKLGRAAKRTLSKFVFDFIRTNPNIYDGVAFFHANHGNLGTTAFSDTEYSVVRLAMMKQVELSSSDRLGIGPSMILCPMDLEKAVSDAFRRSTNLDETFVQSLKPTIIPVWYWTDVTDWAAACNPADMPGIEVGFLDGQEEPELFVQDTPNQGSMFSNDKITYKIRHVYGGNVLPGGERAFYKEVVAG